MNLTSLSFPYGESISWFSPDKIPQELDSPLKEWLLANGSLTKRLKGCGEQFEVKVLGEDLLAPFTGEYPEQDRVWVREVLLCVDNTPWVFARTLIPSMLFSHKKTDFINLGSRSLGELLYSNDEFQQGKIELAQFGEQTRLMQLARELEQHIIGPLWGRRRHFDYQDQHMLVSESFLPHAQKRIAELALTAH